MADTIIVVFRLLKVVLQCKIKRLFPENPFHYHRRDIRIIGYINAQSVFFGFDAEYLQILVIHIYQITVFVIELDADGKVLINVAEYSLTTVKRFVSSKCFGHIREHNDNIVALRRVGHGMAVFI